MRTFQKAAGYSTLALAVLILAFTGSVTAQATMPDYQPDQTIRISVTFEGADAAKIVGVQMIWDTPKAPDNQPNFNTQIYPGASKKTGPNTFEISYTVPHNQARGEYTLAQIRGLVESPSVQLVYPSPEIPERKLTIKNGESLEKPKIKDVKELP
jgi:hypothetical protein